VVAVSTPTADPVLSHRPDAEPFRTAGRRPAETRSLLGEGLVRPVVADVVVAGDVGDHTDVRVAAARLLLPPAAVNGAGWAVGYGSAVWMHLGWWPDGRQDRLDLLLPAGRPRPKDPGLRPRQAAVRADEIVRIGGVPVTGVVRTAADVARDLPPDPALAALRRMGELLGLRPGPVLETLAGMRYSRGAATARRLVVSWQLLG
jgi:hypothetical protein